MIYRAVLVLPFIVLYILICISIRIVDFLDRRPGKWTLLE